MKTLEDILYPDNELRQVMLDPDAEYETAPPMLTVRDTRMMTIGNISAIVGPAKSFKSSLASLIVSAYLCGGIEYMHSDGSNGRVLWVDTEQAPNDCQTVYRRIAQLCYRDRAAKVDRLDYIMLRDKSHAERMEVTKLAIDTFHPSLVVIDGVADLIAANNDERDSIRLQDFLLSTSTVNRCHVICIIHSNTGSDKARGHTGSNLVRKAETILTLAASSDTVKVSPITRGKPFSPFYFTITEEGVPYPCDPATSVGYNVPHMLHDIMRDRKAYSYMELVRLIMEYRETVLKDPITERRAKSIIAETLKHNWTRRAAKGGYILNIPYSLIPASPLPPQPPTPSPEA